MKKKNRKLIGDLVRRTDQTSNRQFVKREKTNSSEDKMIRQRFRLSPFSRVKYIAGAILFVLVVSSVFVVLALPEATVSVRTRTESVTRDLEITVDSSVNDPDSSQLFVPGEFIKREISGEKTYTASGTRNVGEIASGFVQLYNFSKTTLVLRAETTQLQVDGKKYRFTQDVSNIRPTAFIGLEEQEVDQSSLTAPVPVVAIEAGDQYNIEEGTRIELKNEVFGSRPEELYGIVAESGISGGTTRQIKIVTESDIISAYDDLREELVKNARNELSAQDSMQKLSDSSVVTEITDQAVDAKTGDEKERFTAAMVLNLEALVYDEANLLTVIRDRITRLLPENKVYKEDAKYSLESDFIYVNLQEGKGLLRVHFESELSYLIDEKGLKELIRGKTAEQIGELLLSRPEVVGLEVEFFPFWVKRAPRFSNKINIKQAN